jgi:hypothetical protein
MLARGGYPVTAITSISKRTFPKQLVIVVRAGYGGLKYSR